jgi:hypothetical protein
VAPSDDLAICRAMSRAPSWTERGIFRAGAFGQHLDLRAHVEIVPNRGAVVRHLTRKQVEDFSTWASAISRRDRAPA